MIENEIEKPLDFWNRIHEKYNQKEIVSDGWLDMFEDIIKNCTRPILDLGCGSGNNTIYIMKKGKKVIACDLSDVAIEGIQKRIPYVYETKCFDMLDGLPFDDASFELVIADLSLHYFSKQDTFNVLDEISRVLVPGGYLLFRVNSINDINHGAGQGTEIERHYYLCEDKQLKRFFNEEDIRYFFKGFKIVFLNEETMGRYELEKIVYRCCARKKDK